MQQQPAFVPVSQRERCLEEQHVVFVRDGYDGHQRRSGLTTMHRLSLRRARRSWHQRLLSWYREPGAGSLAVAH